MNQIGHLGKKTFAELTADELTDVGQFYAEQNKYPNFESNRKTRAAVVRDFQDQYHGIHVLHEFFEFWCDTDESKI